MLLGLPRPSLKFAKRRASCVTTQRPIWFRKPGDFTTQKGNSCGGETIRTSASMVIEQLQTILPIVYSKQGADNIDIDWIIGFTSLQCQIFCTYRIWRAAAFMTSSTVISFMQLSSPRRQVG